MPKSEAPYKMYYGKKCIGTFPTIKKALKAAEDHAAKSGKEITWKKVKK